ncbi:MAG: hypothetical protein GY796_08450 [Chloroflexi bacterium]|nr:hypothetical protein [Chloroflexota bacterium]
MGLFNPHSLGSERILIFVTMMDVRPLFADTATGGAIWLDTFDNDGNPAD